MDVQIFTDYKELSTYTASAAVELIQSKPDAVVCFASGSTPALACDLFVEKLKTTAVDYSRFTFIGLDEWVGLSPENTGSCRYFFLTKIFQPLELPASQYHLFDALADDPEKECQKMDDFIITKSGIDLMVVGIGMNGHIGFNEPGTSFKVLSHVAALEEVTKSVGQKYFDGHVELSKGITIGLGHLMKAKKVMLIANGLKKAEVIHKTIEGNVTETFPASIMQQLPNSFVLIDEEAASLLSKIQ